MAMKTQSVEDDEALARMLQYEEQTGSSQLTNSGGANRCSSIQELQDMELARQVARMDFEGSRGNNYAGLLSHPHVGRNTRSSTSHAYQDGTRYERSISPASRMREQAMKMPPQMTRMERSQSASSASLSYDEQVYWTRQLAPPKQGRLKAPPDVISRLYTDSAGSFMHDNFHSTPIGPARRHTESTSPHLTREEKSSSSLSGSMHRRTGSVDESLEYVRRLQEQAFMNLNKTNPTKKVTEENADFALARRMQELEDRGMGRINSQRRAFESENTMYGGHQSRLSSAGPTHRGEMQDDRLARLMDESGASIGELDLEALDLLLPKSSQRNRSTDAINLSAVAPSPMSIPSPVPHPVLHSIRETARSRQGNDFPLPESSLIAEAERARLVSSSDIVPRDSGPSTVPLRSAKPLPSLKSAEQHPSSPTKGRTSSPSKGRAMSPLKGSASSPPKGRTSSPLKGRLSLSRLASPNENPSQRFGTTQVRPSGLPQDAFLDVPAPVKREKKKKRGFLGFGTRGSNRNEEEDEEPATIPHVPLHLIPAAVPPPPSKGMGIPSAIPPPPGGSLSAPPTLPASMSSNHSPFPQMRPSVSAMPGATGIDGTGSTAPGPLPYGYSGQRSSCYTCGKCGGSFVAALGKKYHTECFRCVTCNERIDPNTPFKFSTDSRGQTHPHHRHCFRTMFGIQCKVCNQTIPANEDGTVAFVKHPFFNEELMCTSHTDGLFRRCTGCQRFEPHNEPFADLNDADRCVCYACCRSVIVDNTDVKPLWEKVLNFFEKNLKLPVWPAMKQIPILVVGSEALSDQMKVSSNAHGGSQQIMTAGLCLTDHEHGRRGAGRRFKLPSMRFDASTSSFAAVDEEDRGFTFYDVPEASKANPNANVFAILCLSGLPRDLTASVLAHEATHAWIKLHPQHNYRKPIPPQVEEGVAQLVAMLFLCDGLDPPQSTGDDEVGPSDAKLRQFFKFSIERDDNEVYGTGYRRAAVAYRDIGIEALLSHIVLYRDFPQT